MSNRCPIIDVFAASIDDRVVQHQKRMMCASPSGSVRVL